MSRRGAAAAALAMTLFGCEGSAADAIDPSVAITPIAIDEGAVLERASGEQLSLRQLGGGPLFLHFWATWCAPCRRELPALIEAARALGVTVIAVSMDAEWAAVRAFFGDGAVPPSVVREPAGTLARTLGVRALPDTYVIDAHGRATRRIAGAIDWSAPAHRAWLAHALGGHR